MPKNSPKKIASNNDWTNAHYDRISIAVPAGGRVRIKAAADAAGQSVNAYIQAAVDAAITGRPMQTTGAPAPTEQAIPPELMRSAQQAADKAGASLVDWLTLAINKRIDMDQRAALLLSSAQEAKAHAAQATK